MQRIRSYEATTDLKVPVYNVPAMKVVKSFNDAGCTKPCYVVIKVISAQYNVECGMYKCTTG